MLLDNKTIVRRLYEEVWNQRRLDVVDELISPSHALNEPIVSGSQIGPELYKRRVVELTTSFPDLRFTIEDTLTEKSKVVVSWIISGTLPATGSKIFRRDSRFTTSQTGRFSIRTLDVTHCACCDNSVTFLLLDRRPLQRLDEDPQAARDVDPSIFIMRSIYLSLLTSKIPAGLISYRPLCLPKVYAALFQWLHSGHSSRRRGPLSKA